MLAVVTTRLLVVIVLPCVLDASPPVGTEMELTARGLAAAACTGPQSASELLRDLTTGKYDSKSRPNLMGPATQVEVQVSLTSITQVDDKSFSFGVSGYFRTMWTDARLAFYSKAEGGCLDELKVPVSQEGRLWQPDLYFENALSQSWGSSSVQVLPSGYIVKSQRFDHKFECNDMFLGKMPFDRQICRIITGSFSESADEVYVKPYKGSQGVLRPDCYSGTVDWKLEHLSSVLDTSQKGTGENMQPWTMVHLEFTFKRLYMYYIRGYVLVAWLFTMASWSGFFIDPMAAPARVAIGSIPLLTMITLSNGVYEKLPTIPYTTWLNGYIFICLFFCTLTVFEFGLVSYCLHVEQRNAQRLTVLKSLSFLKVARAGSLLKKSMSRPLFGLKQSLPESVQADEGIPGPKQSLPVSVQAVDAIPGAVSEPEPAQPVPLGKSLSRAGSQDLSQAEQSDDAAAYMGGTGVSELQQAMLQSAFDLFKWDKSGSVSLKEARRSMRNFGEFFTFGQVESMFQKLEIEDGGQMTRTHFITFLRSYDSIIPHKVFTKGFFDMPWSYQVDYAMRYSYIISFFFVSIVWLGMIDWYEDSVDRLGQCSA